MKTIFYSVCGEGLGHCSRALVLIKNMPQYRFFLFASGDGVKLAEKMNLPNLRVIEIEGVRFSSVNGKVETLGTISNFIDFWFKNHQSNEYTMLAFLRSIKPCLCIVDWEPSLARVCYNEGIQYISVDSQHKFKFSKPIYSFSLNTYQRLVGLFCNWYIPKPTHNIISTFQSSLIKETQNVTPVHCLIDPSNEEIRHDDFVLVYCKFQQITDKIISTLIENNQKVICYGNKSIKHENVTYKEQDKEAFSKDLRTCKAVFSTAGVQLIGESTYYGKPIFVVPLTNQYEQYINGADVETLNLGMCCNLEDLTSDKVKEFLSEHFNGVLRITNGLEKTINVLESYIE